MTNFEIKTLADMIAFKFRKAGITWLKRYSDNNKTERRVKLYGIPLQDFLDSDLPAYLKRKKIKYKISLHNRKIWKMQDSISFYFPFD